MPFFIVIFGSRELDRKVFPKLFGLFPTAECLVRMSDKLAKFQRKGRTPAPTLKKLLVVKL